MYIVTDDEFAVKFWSRTERTGECWNWTGPTINSGYGCVTRHRRHILAHRFAYTLAFGEIPPGMAVCHKCDNKRCVNPAHLFLGSLADNMQDMVRKGRASWQTKPETRARGSRHGIAKLDEAQAVEIRRLVAAGFRRPEAAARFGVSLSMIDKIINRDNWRHV